MSRLDPRYDRAAASAVLARLGAPGLFGGQPVERGARRIAYTASQMAAEPGRRLTMSQRLYLERFMRPCRPDQVTGATHRITWVDSAGVLNTGHYGPSDLGPMVPIVAREAVLVLWGDLAANRRLARDVADLTDADFGILAATTTDVDPIEIFRIGVEAASRALTQHALIAHHAGIDDPARYARAMRDGHVFATVAATWYWELQASTHRRGMIPARFERTAGGRLRYPAETTALLAAMKDSTIADAHTLMRRAMDEEGLTAAQAVQRYHTDLDLISKQYALLDPGTQPRCLAAMPNVVDGQRVSVLSTVVDAFVATFIRMLDLVEIHEAAAAPAGTVLDGSLPPDGHQRFTVPDMNCRHCRVTITAVLESGGAEVVDVSLRTRQVTARFDAPSQRDAAYAAIGDSGYTVVPG